MPTRSDLQRQAHQIQNPFDEDIPRIQEYTAKEIAILQSRLDKQLGPEYISTRKGPGGQNVHYLGAEKIINLANEVFGFNGWSTSIRDTTIDYVDIEKDGRVSMGLSIIMRVTLRDGTYHEDVGYGTIANCSGKGAAFEKTKKEAATDAMKRALRNFGNVLGNCVYDKEYLKRVVKIKPAPTKWSEDNLHRHPDVTGPKPPTIATLTEKESSLPPPRAMSGQSRTSVGTTDYDDEFGGNAFDDVDFTRSDEFTIHDTEFMDEQQLIKQETNQTAMRQPPPRPQSVPQSAPQSRPSPNTGQRPQTYQAPTKPPMQQQRPAPPPVNAQQSGVPPQAGRIIPPNQTTDGNAMQRPPAPVMPQRAISLTPENMQQRPPGQTLPNGLPGGQQAPETPVGFVRGRVAEMVQGANGQLPANSAFNPHAESPSIRKTSGVNHRTSAPVRRDELGVSLPPATPTNGVAQGITSANMNNSNTTATNGAPLPPVQNSHMPAVPRSNFVNPQQDPHRRIGAPYQAGMQSPGPRAGAYKPPGPAGIKRGPPETITRPPLGDVSNVKTGMHSDVGAGDGDAKRMRGPGQEDDAGPIAA